MKFTKLTLHGLEYRKAKRDNLRDGFILLESPYLPIINGVDYAMVITDVRIAPGGKDLFIKIAEKTYDATHLTINTVDCPS